MRDLASIGLAADRAPERPTAGDAKKINKADVL